MTLEMALPFRRIMRLAAEPHLRFLQDSGNSWTFSDD
jgi:hypothetical protein